MEQPVDKINYIEKKVQVPVYEERLRTTATEVEKIYYEDLIKENNRVIKIPVVSTKEKIVYRDNKIEQIVEMPKLRIFDKDIPVDIETDRVVEKMKEVNVY